MTKNESCPISHEDLKSDKLLWQSLPYVGVQLVDGGASLELRNCLCGSTLCVEIRESGE